MTDFSSYSITQLDSTVSLMEAIYQEVSAQAQYNRNGDPFNAMDTEELKFIQEFWSKLDAKQKEIVDILVARSPEGSKQRDYYQRVRGRLETRFIDRCIFPGWDTPWIEPYVPEVDDRPYVIVGLLPELGYTKDAFGRIMLSREPAEGEDVIAEYERKQKSLTPAEDEEWFVDAA
jgi:hypothetical protein